MNKPTRAAPAASAAFMGGPTVLTVLLSLILCCFALLTWYRARTDYQYAARSALTVSEYYAADSRADELIAQVAEALRSNPPAQVGMDMAALFSTQGLESKWDEGTRTLHCTIPAGLQGDLELRLRLTARGAEVLSRVVRGENSEAEENTLTVILP